jgi:hypothetical protein
MRGISGRWYWWVIAELLFSSGRSKREREMLLKPARYLIHRERGSREGEFIRRNQFLTYLNLFRAELDVMEWHGSRLRKVTGLQSYRDAGCVPREDVKIGSVSFRN